MTNSSNDGLYRNPDLAQFYGIENEFRADYDFCRNIATNAASILDLGCGTGNLTTSFPKSANVVGVDPAAAMLEIARKQQGGEDVTWIEADARQVRLETKFDLVLLTGHAFQVFLTTDEQVAVLQTIAEHLHVGGTFLFDSRNPSFPSRKDRNKTESLHRIEHLKLGSIDAWCESDYDDEAEILTYSNSYHVLGTGDVQTAEEKIRYTSKSRLAELLSVAGLTANEWLGDWDGSPYYPSSKEIIPVGRLASK